MINTRWKYEGNTKKKKRSEAVLLKTIENIEMTGGYNEDQWERKAYNGLRSQPPPMRGNKLNANERMLKLFPSCRIVWSRRLLICVLIWICVKRFRNMFACYIPAISPVCMICQLISSCNKVTSRLRIILLHSKGFRKSYMFFSPSLVMLRKFNNNGNNWF